MTIFMVNFLANHFDYIDVRKDSVIDLEEAKSSVLIG